MERETSWLLESAGLCLGIGGDQGVHWVPFTWPRALRFARREDAEAVQHILVKVREKGFRVCPRDVGIAVATEHAWVDAPCRGD